jgi:hypothetical protein
VTITITHAAHSDTFGVPVTVVNNQPAKRAAPLSAVMKVSGKALRLPGTMTGRTVAVAVYDLRGKRVASYVACRKARLDIAGEKGVNALFIVKLHSID